MNHYGYIPSYGCARFSLVAIGPVITTVDISTTTSGNGGSWGFQESMLLLYSEYEKMLEHMLV